MNKLILIGNLTRDPEMKATKSGKSVCEFTIAVNDRQGNAQYFRISAWEKRGESCGKYLSKGKKVYVSGPVTARTYQTSSGETRVSMEVTADEVEFLSSRDPAEQAYQKQEREAIQQEAPAMVAVETEELPF